MSAWTKLKNVLIDYSYQTTVFRYYQEFRRRNFSTDDIPHSSCLSMVTSDVLKKIKNLITEKNNNNKQFIRLRKHWQLHQVFIKFYTSI